jgi:hypothetical protein
MSDSKIPIDRRGTAMAPLVLLDNVHQVYGALQRYDVIPGEPSVDWLPGEPSTNRSRI